MLQAYQPLAVLVLAAGLLGKGLLLGIGIGYTDSCTYFLFFLI